MGNVIVLGERTLDSEKYKKDCGDFECLNDGTLTGEYRYCRWSSECRQIDYDECFNVIAMESHYLPVFDPLNNELIEHELFCTGFYEKRQGNERYEDDKVS